MALVLLQLTQRQLFFASHLYCDEHRETLSLRPIQAKTISEETATRVMQEQSRECHGGGGRGDDPGPEVQSPTISAMSFDATTGPDVVEIDSAEEIALLRGMSAAEYAAQADVFRNNKSADISAEYHGGLNNLDGAEWWINDCARRRQQLEPFKQWQVRSQDNPDPEPAPKIQPLSNVSYMKTREEERNEQLEFNEKVQDADGDPRREPPAFNDDAAKSWWQRLFQAFQFAANEQARRRFRQAQEERRAARAREYREQRERAAQDDAESLRGREQGDDCAVSDSSSDMASDDGDLGEASTPATDVVLGSSQEQQMKDGES